MIQRCTNPNNTKFSYYGGRGIEVCESWLNSYPQFLMDMGRRPTSVHTLDRLDNEVGYTPETCRWSTREFQSRNRRNNVVNLQDVIQIRQLYREGITQTEIAKIFNLKLYNVSKIVNNKTWKHF